jgi:hypothetical protein
MLEEVNVSSGFNASFVITELLSKTLENVAKELVSRCIKECGLRHGFDASEEIRVLGLENVSLVKKQMPKKSCSKGEKKAKKASVKCSLSFPLPFIPDRVDLSKCNGLTYNRGMFTQCAKEQMVNSMYCKGCQSECDSSANGIPMCGNVQQRLASGLYEFKDAKGRSPIRYTKVLEKAKMTKEQSLEEACKLSIVIDPEHFVVAEKKKSRVAKGRPKKAVGAVEAADVTDLFAKLTAEGDEEVAEEAEPVAKAKKSKLSDEEKSAKKAALEAERAAKKAEREAKVAEEKAEREAKRKAEVEQKKAEREAKVAEEKAEREAKRKAEVEEKKANKALEKEAKKTEKKAKSKKADSPVAAPVAAPAAPAAPADPSKIKVKRIYIEGKEYLKSSTNVLYNPETKEEIGIYDEATDSIKPLPEEESDEEEEESDEEEEEEYEDDN